MKRKAREHREYLRDTDLPDDGTGHIFNPVAPATMDPVFWRPREWSIFVKTLVPRACLTKAYREIVRFYPGFSCMRTRLLQWVMYEERMPLQDVREMYTAEERASILKSPVYYIDMWELMHAYIPSRIERLKKIAAP